MLREKVYKKRGRKGTISASATPRGARNAG